MMRFNFNSRSLFRLFLSQQRFFTTTRCLQSVSLSHAKGPTDEPLIDITVGRLLQNAADKFGDEEAVVSCHQNISKSFTQANKEATDLAASFISLGLQPGDRLGMWGPNSYEWYITSFAAAKAGLILVNINPSYRAPELDFCLKKVQVKGIVCAEKAKTTNFHDIMQSVVPELKQFSSGDITSPTFPHLKTVISMSDQTLRGAFKFKDLLTNCDSRKEDYLKLQQLDKSIQSKDAYNIQFTSGTTGNPKAALLSHHNVTNNAYFNAKRTGYDKKKARVCLCVPLFHCFGGVVGAMGNAFFGSTTVFPSMLFDAKVIVRTLESQRITSCYGTPTMFVDILKEYKENPVDISKLHTGIMTGAPCPKELVLAVMNDLNMKDYLVVYGMTETSPVSFQCFPDDPVEVRSTTIGYPSSHVEVKIVDNMGQTVPRGTPGELWVRGYSVFMGYWQDEQKTKETLTDDGWLKTGDLVMMNEQGYGAVTGRIKDLVIRGGENIYPAEVENFFMSHEDIIEAQVFGVPDERMGEEVAMWLRVKDNATINPDSLKAWAKGKIAHYKIPRYISVHSDFPRTISGKVQKIKMKEATVEMLGL